MLEKIKSRLRRERQQEQLAIGALVEANRTTATHIVAIARLSFIPPETLAREANNVKANGEYLLKMVEYIKKEKEDKTKK